MNVSKIGIDRLYNLGNYEHVKYSIAVDLKEGESATHALQQLEAIIEALNPRPVGIPSADDIARLEARYERESKMSAAEFERQIGTPVGGAAAYLERVMIDLAEKKLKRSEWEQRRAKCREAFNNLGGEAVYTDAKQDWDTDQSNF